MHTNRNGYGRTHLAVAVALAITFTPQVWAANLGPGQSGTVGSGSPVEDWTLLSATLTVTPGGETGFINTSNKSKVFLDGATVKSSTSSGIHLLESDAMIANTAITSEVGTGLILDRNGNLQGDPSTASVIGSSISGVGAGVLVSQESTLLLSGTTVTGTAGAGLAGFGIGLLGGNATIQNGSSVSGDANGLLLSGIANATTPMFDVSANVDRSSIVGLNGSGILVNAIGGEAANATVNISNGSTVTGGNGLAVEVTNNATLTMTVDNSTLNGGILVDAGSNADVMLNNNSRMAGNVTNVADLTLNNGSSLTGNLTDTTNLNVNNNSSVTGNVANVENFSLTGNSSLSGNLSNVENLSLDNSTWTTNDGNGVTNLSMNAGTVKFGDTGGTFETLTVETLSGNGRFIMDTDLAAHQSDLVNVTGHATGNYDLQIANTGAEPLKGDQDQQVVHTGAGSDAAFAVVGGQVDLGTFAYGLEQRGTDWFLVQKVDDNGDPVITPGTESVLDLFSAAPTVWYGELSTLRSRMGELRYGQSGAGGWMRAYGNKFNTSAGGGSSYSQNQQGISFGADGKLPSTDGQWLLGVLGGYSKSDLDIASGTSGTVHSTYIGAYSTWLSDEGYYIDAIVKANHFKNKSNVRMSDGTKANGDYNNNGIGGSIEAGKHIKLADDWFVEPFTQVSALWVDGDSYSLDNGMNASSNKADSFLGKVGTVVGRNFATEKGGFVQPYVKVALAHEFANNNKVKVNDTHFRNDLSGSRGEIGAGIAMQVSDKWQVHGDVDYSNGEHIEQPWGVNLGVRYNW